MNNIQYHYSDNNLLENPQRYQTSTFDGPEFLKAYSKSRHDNLDTITKKNHPLISFEELVKQLESLRTDWCTIRDEKKDL